MKLRHKLSPLALLPLALLAVPARAQLTLTLTPASQAGPAPSTFHFTGTLSNPTASEVFLNSDSLTFNGPASTLDDSPFLNNAPLSLGPAGSGSDTYTGGFFDVTLNSSAAPGTYFGTFEVLGGPTASDQNIVASEDFSVTVTSAPVPEASSPVGLGLLLALGMGGMALGARRKAAPTR